LSGCGTTSQNKSTATLLTCDNRKVNFHMEYSCGTAAIRGNKELADRQHFWEIKMTSLIYGTDMMVGIGTSDVNLDKYRHTFCSLLGKDEDSWGLSTQDSCITKETKPTSLRGLAKAPSLGCIWTRGTGHSRSSKNTSA
ncbi:SPRY domain-containing SOCS box protein 3-like, partial [Haliaeetus albicilla]|uniref:SPRY domain-containing SOCS box protein 3-like n=1 Tax=Haliaeetus albicilla TaxID=8969 RepID=UPI0037E75DEC